MPERPNVLLVVADQYRGDCVGRDPATPTDDRGDPVVHTPTLNSLVDEGALFSQAYTPVPSCAPARRCLRTGQTPASCDSTNWTTEPWDFEHELTGQFAAAGYETMLAGKLHAFPPGNRLGFERSALQPGPEYEAWLAEQVPDRELDEYGHGVGPNAWDARPFHLDEVLHPTTWTTNRALEFLDSRDSERPFFLNVSYLKPHTPLNPPRAYWEFYADRDLPPAAVGDWVDAAHGADLPAYPPLDAWCGEMAPDVVKRARRGYYGLVTHLDHQLSRVIRELRAQGEWENTVVVFTADHGDMLGDHHLWRKCYGYEPSARVPFIVKPPGSADVDPHLDDDDVEGRTIGRPVGLEDVMPTLLDACELPIPETVEGGSVLRLLDDPATDDWRAYYHGEHGPIYEPENATQYLVGERYKLVWNPVTGTELLFDLRSDPLEERDRIEDPDHADVLDTLETRLVERLRGREEGFTDGEGLVRTEVAFAAGHYTGYDPG
ncbi:MAG: sulfatase-like hydrolase/transferase [Halobacteriales archaeon]